MSARRQAALLALPGVLALLALFALPHLLMFEVSLGRRSPYGAVEHVWSAANYARAFDPLYASVFARGLALAAVTTVATLLAGYPLAYWIAVGVAPRWRPALVGLVMLPFWTSLLVRTYAWMSLLRAEGLLPRLLAALGLPGVDLLHTDAAVLIGQVSAELPYMVLPLYATLERHDATLREAAADLGAAPSAVFRHVTLPLSLPGIAAGSLLVFIPSLGSYLVPDLLGGGRTAYAGNLIQNQFAIARDMPFGASLAFGLAAMVIVLALLFRRTLEKA